MKPDVPVPTQDFHELVCAGQSEHYDDAVLYDYEYRGRRRDANFYAQLARDHLEPTDPILELACGSGRVTRTLIKAGFAVVGVDRSRAMVARARRRLARLSRAHRERFELVCADMRSLRLGRRFPLVVMAFNSFEHLYTNADVRSCLARVRELLEPGGLFAFDVQNPDLEWLRRDSKVRWAHTEFRHPTSGEELVYSTNHIYDPITQICVIRLYYRPVVVRPSALERTVVLSQRKFFPAELTALVDANGFDLVARYGGFRHEPLIGGTESQVMVCRLR